MDEKIKHLTSFDPFGTINPTNQLNKYIGLAFFVAPSLFISINENTTDPNEQLAYENMLRDSFFAQFLSSSSILDKIIIKQLSYTDKQIPSIHTDFNMNTNFIPILTNRLLEFATKDSILDSVNLYTTREGYNQLIPTTLSRQDASDQITIKFQETANMDIFKIMGIWTRYIHNINRGIFHANPECIKNGIIDYFGSIYYFMLSRDASRIIYYAKYTGVAPVSVPYSEFSFSKGSVDGSIDPEITFAYSHKEDMNPDILYEFNYLLYGSIKDEEDKLNELLNHGIVPYGLFTINSSIPIDKAIDYIPAPFVYKKVVGDHVFYKMNLNRFAVESTSTYSITEMLDHLYNGINNVPSEILNEYGIIEN